MSALMNFLQMLSVVFHKKCEIKKFYEKVP